MLATHPDMGAFIETLYTREITTPLSKSALETLAIILYSGPISKSEIDHIRGVNSQFMLRNLLVRGLIEKKDNPDDKRRSWYQTSSDTLTFLGITHIDELPSYEACLEKLQALREHSDTDESSG
jgi:segregation and condensation protein B